MDVFQFLEQRTVKIDEIFSREVPPEPANDLFHVFRKLGHLFEKKVKVWWDITTFEQYISAKLTPRRLRWDVPANDGLFDDDSVKEWGDFFMRKGVELMELLLRRKQRKMKSLESQIQDLQVHLEPHKDSEEFLRLSGELKQKLAKWDSETQAKKKKKFLRDLKDYNEGVIFKWQANVPRDPMKESQEAEDGIHTPMLEGIKTPRFAYPNQREYSTPRANQYTPLRQDEPQWTKVPNRRGRGRRGRGVVRNQEANWRNRGPPGGAPWGYTYQPSPHRNRSPYPRDQGHQGSSQIPYRAPSGTSRGRGRGYGNGYNIRGPNRYAPLQGRTPREEGDFQEHQNGPGGGYQYWDEEEWWRPPQPDTQRQDLSRKRKGKEEKEGVKESKRPKPQ